MNRNGIFISKLKTVIVLISMLLLTVVLGSIQVVRAVGKNNLRSGAENYAPAMKEEFSEPLSAEEETVWRDGLVKYNEKIFAYNEDILSFLMIGKSSVEDTDIDMTDPLFLVVLNPHDDSIHMIAIEKATLPDLYREGTRVDFNAVQKCVSELLSALPIHGYVAVSTETFSAVCEAVGDTVTVSHDSTQELREFIDTVRDAVESGRITERELCRILFEHADTNMTVNEAAYIAPLMKKYKITDESFVSLQGEDLYDFTIRLFYEEID